MNLLFCFLFFLITTYLQVTKGRLKNHGFPMLSIFLGVKSFFLQIQKITSYFISRSLKKALGVRTAGGHYKNNLTNGITFKGVTIVNSCCHAGHRVCNSNVISVFTVRTILNLPKRNLFGDTKKLKQMSFRLLLWIGLSQLGVGCCTLSDSYARDLGTHGVLFPVEEEDPIQLIQQKLKVIKENGGLERHNHILQKKGKAAVERPKPVEGITRATQGRVFYYDPTYVVKADLVDHQGHVFYKKGTKINPLETVGLSQNLLFFDGDDEEQKNFAKEKLHQGSLKLILIKGAPLALSEEIKVPVYFDQQGVLTKKLRITQVPALVTQEKTRLRIEEVCLRTSDPKIDGEEKK